MPGSRTPGKVHVVPALVVYPQPACLKLDATSLNCLQPIVILLPLVGSTPITHSFAASPTMFWPLASTFTWKLVNVSSFEIIRGEVSIFRGGAGGLSYISSGTSRGTLVVGATWPEARGIKSSESRQVKTAAFDILKRIIVKKILPEQTTPIKTKRKRQSTALRWLKLFHAAYSEKLRMRRCSGALENAYERTRQIQKPGGMVAFLGTTTMPSRMK